jgi:molybdate transport system substrate-binding protein
MRLLILLLPFLLFANTIYVGAAANTAFVMPDIIKAYKKKYHQDVKVIVASSGKLTAQILHGAKYDVFLSANLKYPQYLKKRGYTKSDVKVYAKGAISLFSVKNIDLKNIDYSKILCIAIANPKTAPYGVAAVEYLKNSGNYDKVKDKIVYSENVSGVISYVLHSCDVGIVARSLLFSDKMKRYKNRYDIPQKYYKPIDQGAVLLSERGKNFFNFLFSKTAREIFKKYGYIY